MDISALTAPASTTQADGIQKSFREADFLAVMLTEITNQDPFQPTETAKMVEQMQQLQSLANSNYEKYRADIQWADSLVGKEITVTQVNMTTAEAQVLAPLEFTALVWATLVGFLFFGEVPRPQVFIGGVVIVAACLWGAQKEKRKLMTPFAPATPPAAALADGESARPS